MTEEFGAVLVHDFLCEAARRSAEKVAIIDAVGEHTFGELDALSDRFAAWLQSAGLRRGDRVVVIMENSAMLFACLFGAFKAGGVGVVLNPTTKCEKLTFILDDCAATVIVAASQLVREVLPAIISSTQLVGCVWIGGMPTGAVNGVDFDDIVSSSQATVQDPGIIDADLATIIYTSGSTGAPKGVMLTHRNVCHNSWSISTYLGLERDDVVVNVMPLAFDYGLFQLFMSARVGFTVLLERSFAYPYDLIRRMAEHQVTVLPGVPTIFSALLALAPFDDIDLSSIRILTNTAAALPPAHIRRLMELLPRARIFSMYGLTECTRVSYLEPDRLDDKLDSVGKAMPNTEVYLVDELGERVPIGGSGELVVRGASVMRGYWGRPEETARALRPGKIDGEIVLHSGDQFRTDAEGFLYFIGRSDDVFKCKGEKVSPKEVEHVLYELEGVIEAAVVGVPDDRDGFAVKVYVVLRPSSEIDAEAVKRHCRRRLESHLVPKFVEIRDSLPTTESGKIQRRLL